MALPASTCTTRSTDPRATSRPDRVNTIDGAHPSQAGNDLIAAARHRDGAHPAAARLIAGLLAKVDVSAISK